MMKINRGFAAAAAALAEDISDSLKIHTAYTLEESAPEVVEAIVSDLESKGETRGIEESQDNDTPEKSE